VWELKHPSTAQHFFINYAVLGIAMLFEGSTWVFAVNEFFQGQGPAQLYCGSAPR